ncbi:MAG: cytochrome c biogenesis protein CcdA [Armatimonadetes bacterium]|nr:MAG: cytochrome c biogenesis protein CcdA [Armatimonadota bacterium]
MEGLLFQTSLIAAFVAGMVALFAPCCITFLLPAYLGSVFKEKEKVLFMTLIFGLGIFVVLLPAVLGVAFVSKFLFRYHNMIYLTSGLVMLAVAGVSFFGIKMPMPQFKRTNPAGKTDVLSVFTLGIFSGLTSACCAPVLIGLLALTFLSPSFFGALTLGGVYVLGMVVPLLLISLFLDGQLPKLTALRRPVGTFSLGGKQYPLIISNLIASIVFLTTGILTIFLTLTGRLSMQSMSGMTDTVQGAGQFINTVMGDNVLVNIIFMVFVGLFLFKIIQKGLKSKE